MKKIIISVLIFIVIPLAYALWPVYQGLAYRDKVPLFGSDFIAWPPEQPSASIMYQKSLSDLDSVALNLVKNQQREINAPGYTAAVAVNGELVWAGSVGWSDIANEEVMTTETRLRIGSTSKALTSAGLAKLVEGEKLTLDTPLKQVFAQLPNPDWANITARHLSSHMAGIPHYKENTELLGKLETVAAQTHFSNVEDSLSLFDESDVLFKPGKKFSYSSLGTVVLSALMQKAAGVSYQELMHNKVFAPLEMNATSTEARAEQAKLATFYWQNSEQKSELKPWYELDLSHRLAGGGWVSTSKDLAKLGQAFLNPDFIPESIRETFWTPQTLNNGEVNEQKYGIGWRIHTLNLGDGFKPLTYMHHGGVSAGAQSFLMVIPEYNMSIAVNANVRTKVFWDFGKVSYDLARLFISRLEQNKKIKYEKN